MTGKRVLATERLVPEVVGEMMTVSPAQAKEWLATHENIRPLSDSKVDTIADDILHGRWKPTHQGIDFNEEDKLIDGQHRLHAIVQANRTVRLFVCRSRGVTMHDPIDRGTPRRIATLTGRKTREVAAAGVLRFFEKGEVEHRPLSVGEAQEIFEHHDKAFYAISGIRGSGRIIGGALAACVWAHPIWPTEVERFVEQIAWGEMIKQGDPAYAFRNWQSRPSGRRSHAENAGLAAANCLRYYLDGEKLASVFDGMSGYRALTTRRRKHRLPHTPAHEVVKSLQMTPGHGETSRSD